MSELFITAANLDQLVASLQEAGTAVIAPMPIQPCPSPAARASAACLRGGSDSTRAGYRLLAAGETPALGQAMPDLSLKGFFLPQNEALLSWRRSAESLEVTEAPPAASPRVVIGARPCDAGALELLDCVMGWEHDDELWAARRGMTTIVNLSCPVEDDSCFCAAMGMSPEAVGGADALLTPVYGGYLYEAATAKGLALATGHAARFDRLADADLAEPRRQADAFHRRARERAEANLQLNRPAVRAWIDTHFEDPLLAALGARCNGCGVCSSVCPTCHCFDIVDEPEGVTRGTRRRCWDSCQTGKFTAHASGHNPRADQDARFRQRINHKFNIYPLRFGEVLCTGCGRCTRACHAGQDLIEILTTINEAAAQTSQGTQSRPARGGP